MSRRQSANCSSLRARARETAAGPATVEDWRFCCRPGRPGPGSFSNSTWIRSVDHCSFRRAPPAIPPHSTPGSGRFCGDAWVSSDGRAGRGLVSYHNWGRQGHGCPRETGNLSWRCSAKVQGTLYVRSSQYAARASATQWIDRPISPRRPARWMDRLFHYRRSALAFAWTTAGACTQLQQQAAERHHVGASTVALAPPACWRWRYVLLLLVSSRCDYLASVAWRGLAAGRWPLCMHV
jgi:hypothetical protein